MVQLVLSEEQVRLLKETHGPVELIDPSGKILGDFVPGLPTAELVKMLANRGKHQKTYTTTEVLERLRELE